MNPTNPAASNQAGSEPNQPTEPTSNQAGRISRRRLADIKTGLSLCDRDVLTLLGQHRFLTSRQVAGLAHADAASPLAGVRAAQRQLQKLAGLKLVDHLPQKIGGQGGGQTQTVWHLSETGHRLQATTNQTSQPASSRYRYREPSLQFLNHTLRVADIRLILEQARQTTNGKELSLVEIEPVCWRHWVGPYGVPAVLKPDLYVELADQQFDYYWFIEADLGSEHLPAIIRKANIYRAYQRTGREQTRLDGIFPLVLWVTPDQHRADQITAALQADPNLDQQLHQTVPIDKLAGYLNSPNPGWQHP